MLSPLTYTRSVLGRKSQIQAELAYPTTLKRLSKVRHNLLQTRVGTSSISDLSSEDLFPGGGTEVGGPTSASADGGGFVDSLEGLFDPRVPLSTRLGRSAKHSGGSGSYASFRARSKDVAAFCDQHLLKCIGTALSSPISPLSLLHQCSNH